MDGRAGTGPDWELGSDFHWDAMDFHGPGPETAAWLPAGSVLFSSFTGALTGLVDLLPGRPVVHLPSYFWMGMVGLLPPDVQVRYYRELPDGNGPAFDTLRPAAGDLVLAANLFGRADRRPWARWAAQRRDVVLVEDHTHDPISPWARSSAADYCVASLRKTVPVPDGAPIWSPAGRPLPTPRPEESPAAQRKLAAMLLKAAWLKGRGPGKEQFRELQTTGERALSAGTFSPTSYTRAALAWLDVERMRAARVANVARFTACLPARADLTALTHCGPDTTPFGVQLVCRNEPVRDALRAHLAAHNVFAPVHWAHPRGGDPQAVDIGQRILTIPFDHRYGSADVDRVLDVLADHPQDQGAARQNVGQTAGSV